MPPLGCPLGSAQGEGVAARRIAFSVRLPLPVVGRAMRTLNAIRAWARCGGARCAEVKRARAFADLYAHRLRASVAGNLQ